ncbi:hypothetical protein DFJ73DRAFT_107842 [Zopfochytrium polystomum]|nr:hypothetical protein DFJ73DRAFT_107842 [Zopfochytrium polystomum]
MTELLLISNLNSQVLECPLLPAIMSSSASLASSIGVCTSKYEDICALAEDTACEYTLNPDQKAVLESFVLSLLGKRHPITLCFGVFGSGKSFLVCVIIILLHRMWKLELLPQDFKVVISSMTNVAVDRILLVGKTRAFGKPVFNFEQGLAKLGFNEFVRVGSLKKIAKPLLPFTAQGQKGESDGEFWVTETALFLMLS